MVTNCHTFGLLVMLLSFVPFTSELQRVFSLVKFQLTEPKKSYVPQCTSENTPPKGTHVQGKNKMDKKKIIIKNSLLNFRFELSSAVSHKQHFVIAFKHSTELSKAFLFKPQHYKVLSRNVLQSHHDFEETRFNLPFGSKIPHRNNKQLTSKILPRGGIIN